MTEDIVPARIEGKIKEKASTVLKAMGLTISDAFRMLLIRIAHEKSLPFSPLVPNAETIEALRSARKGELITSKNLTEIFNDLNADD